MTKTTFLAFCRLRIPEIASTDVISDANLLIIANQACTEFINKTDALPTSTDFNLVLNLLEYPLSTYISSFAKIRREGLWWFNTDTSKWKYLDGIDEGTLRIDYPDWLNTASGNPLRYSLTGDILVVHPPASSNYAGDDRLKLYHYARSIDMVGDNNNLFTGSDTKRYPHLADYEEVPIEYVRSEIKMMLKKNVDAKAALDTFYAKATYVKNQLAHRPDLAPNARTNMPTMSQAQRTFQG
jgi:hypothetical protein